MPTQDSTTQDSQQPDCKSLIRILRTRKSMGNVTIAGLSEMVQAWANQAVPKRTYKSTLTKMVMEEIPEFLQTPNAEELADIWILLLDIGVQLGIDPVEAVLDKMEVNANRTFVFDKDAGFYNHVEGE